VPDIYTLGAARVTDASGSNILPVVKLQLEVDPESGDAEDFGEVPLMPCLGITALPAPPDDSGRAEGLAIEGAGGFTAVVAGARDARCVDVVAQLQPGETAVHNTGGDKAKRSRLFCKEDLLALLVGDDTTFVIDRGQKYAILAIPEAGQFELSKAKGFMVSDTSGAGIVIKDGKMVLNAGQVTLPGGLHVGGDTAQPLVKSVGLLGYLSALETLLVGLAGAIDAKTPSSPGVSVGVVNAFISAGASLKTQLTALTTNGS